MIDSRVSMGYGGSVGFPPTVLENCKLWAIAALDVWPVSDGLRQNVSIRKLVGAHCLQHVSAYSQPSASSTRLLVVLARAEEAIAVSAQVFRQYNT